MEIHQLGIVKWKTCMELQSRIARDVAARNDAKSTVLLVEHPNVITVGQAGSRADIHISQEQLDRENVAIYHSPGQLAIYPIMSLSDRNWTSSEYTMRLLSAIESTLKSLGVNARGAMTKGNAFAVWGRIGPIAMGGIQIDEDVVTQGAFINVHPPYQVLKRVHGIRRLPADNKNEWTHNEKQCMTSLVAEQGRPAKMNRVRSFLLPALAKAMDHSEFHPTFGHPWLNATEQRDARLDVS